MLLWAAQEVLPSCGYGYLSPTSFPSTAVASLAVANGALASGRSSGCGACIQVSPPLSSCFAIKGMRCRCMLIKLLGFPLLMVASSCTCMGLALMCVVESQVLGPGRAAVVVQVVDVCSSCARDEVRLQQPQYSSLFQTSAPASAADSHSVLYRQVWPRSLVSKMSCLPRHWQQSSSGSPGGMPRLHAQ